MKLIKLIYSYLIIKNGVYGDLGTESADNDNSVCYKPYMRKEIRDLTELEVKQFITALRQLRKNGFWDKIVKFHFSSDNYAHFTPVFLPYHRLLLRLVEQEIQKIYPNLFLPFWNWAKDSQNPEKSIVFTNAYFGGNGEKEDNVVSKGPFAFDWVLLPEEGHLKRQFDNGDTINSFPALEHLENIIRDSNTYHEFNEEISAGPHASAHEGIGGIVGHICLMSSPADPLFFLHHTFIDMLWWNWQQRKGEIGMSYDGHDADLHDPIIPWGIPVYKLLDTRSYGNCYVYPEFKVDLPEMPKINATRRLSANLRNKNSNNGAKNGISEETSLKSLMNKISNGEIEGESVSSTDREKKGKIRSPKPLSPRIMKMFKIPPKVAKKQNEKMDLLSQALNIAVNHEPESKLQEVDPEDLIPPGLKKWAEKFS